MWDTCSHRVPSPSPSVCLSLPSSLLSPFTQYVSPTAFHLVLPTLRVCTHSLMLIRLNAQKPSRGRDERLASSRFVSPDRKITDDHKEGARLRRLGWSWTISWKIIGMFVHSRVTIPGRRHEQKRVASWDINVSNVYSLYARYDLHTFS